MLAERVAPPRNRVEACSAGDLLLRFLLGELGPFVSFAELAQFLLQELDLLERRLPHLLGLSHLPMQIGVVLVELGDAAIQLLHLRGERLRLLLERVLRRRHLARRGLKGSPFAAEDSSEQNCREP